VHVVILALLLAAASVVIGVLAVRRARANTAATQGALRTLDAVLDFAPVGVAVLDTELRFVRVNQALTRLSGRSAEMMLGYTLDEIVLRPELPVIARSVLATGNPAFGLDASGSSTAGRPFRAVADLYPVRADGEVVGLGVIVHDITAAARVDEERRRLLERLSKLQRVTEALGSARTSDELVRVVVEDVRDACRASTATLVLSDGATIHLAGTSERNLAAVSGWMNDRPLDDSRIIREAIERREVIVLTPDLLAARWSEVSRALPPGDSLVALPLIADDDVLGGVILRLSSSVGVIRQDEVFLAAVATQIAEALARVTREESEQARSAAIADRLAFVAEASDAFASSPLDWQAILRQVVEVTSPRLADVAAAFVLDGADIIGVETTAVPDDRRHAVQQLMSHWSDAFREHDGGHALRTKGEPVLVTDLAAPAGSATETLAAAGFASIMAAPLRADARAVGLLVLATEHPRRLNHDDLGMAEEIAKRAGHFIFNAERFQERSHVADTLQASLLPPATPSIPGLELATRFFAVGEGIDVGGDFYDVFRMGTASAPTDRWAVVIGDVRGKGPEAASISGAARHAIRAASLHDDSPASILRQVNELLLVTANDDVEPRFCTAIVASVRPTELGASVILAVGGHPAPMLLRADGHTEAVAAFGTVLGVLDHLELEEVELILQPGDALVLYTDGVTERHAGGRFFDDDALASVLSRCTGFTAPVLAERIETASRAFLEDVPRDDLAVVVLRVPEPVASASAASTDLPSDVSASLLGRRFVVAALSALGLDEHAETATLLASELVTNALLHAVGPYRIGVESAEGVLRIGLTDATTDGPQLVSTSEDATSGRGIRLVDSLANRWGVHLNEGGKTVWFELET
jgi:PAS domain S-box-containing protein